MPDSTLEFEKTSEIPLDQWVKPFENYEALPARGKGPDRGLYKSVEYRSPEIGNWGTDLTWEQGELETSSKDIKKSQEEVLIVLPDGAKVIKEYELKQYQEQMESRLMRLLVGRDQETYDRDDPPTTFESLVKLTTGEELKSKLSPITARWEFGKTIFRDIYIPDVPGIPEQISVKIQKTSAK